MAAPGAKLPGVIPGRAVAKGKIPDGFQEALVPHSNPPEVFVIDQKYSCKEILGKGSYGLVWLFIFVIYMCFPSYLSVIDCLFILVNCCSF